MACAAFDSLARRTESLNEAIHQSRVASIADIWKNLVKRGLYGKGNGYEKTSFTLDNMHAPSVTPAWQDVVPLNGSANTIGPCAHAYNDVYWGYDQRTYGPERFDIRGPVLCKKQFTYDFQPAKFISGYAMRLRNISDEVIGNRYQEHYVSLSNKVICLDGAAPAVTPGVYLEGSVAAAALPATEATSTLTQSILDYFVPQLIRDGAGFNDADQYGFITLADGAPVFTLFLSMEMSNALTQQSGLDGKTLANMQAAYQGKGDQALFMKSIGANFVLKNFRHVINLLPPRYNFTGGAYVRVQPFIQVDATGRGKKQIPNPDYQLATHEAAIIQHPSVMNDEIVQPENAGLSFKTDSYYGEWDFKTGGRNVLEDACYDPHEEYGRHFAQFEHAIEPVKPELGYTFIYKRCDQVPWTLGCPAGS